MKNRGSPNTLFNRPVGIPIPSTATPALPPTQDMPEVVHLIAQAVTPAQEVRL